MTNFPANFEQIVSELRSAGLDPVIIRAPEGHFSFIGVAADTRKLDPSKVFCAIRGKIHDGHSYLENPPSSLTVAVIEDAGAPLGNGLFGVIKVSSSRAAWAQLASYFSGHPSRKLKMIGVTGTNGKTSTVWMIKSILDAIHVSSATIGTLGFYIGNTHRESNHTTPDPDVLYPLLAELVTKSISHVVMEVSSHSLEQGKVWPIDFAAAAFTSFSQDHLDFHATMADYFAAKMKLFTKNLSRGGFGLFHNALTQFPAARDFINKAGQNSFIVATYAADYGGPSPLPDFTVKASSNYISGFSRVSLRSSHSGSEISIMLSMVGDIFAENLAAALVLVSTTLKMLPVELGERLANSVLPAIPGRLQLITPSKLPWRPLVYIDYAHTPDAIEKAIRTLSKEPNSVTTVFGCGGDRDSSKRALMGTIASRLSKDVIVTSDNPRNESPDAIVNEVLSGISHDASTQKVLDRRTAISKAIHTGGGLKKVLIAGKGHEDYQIIGETKYRFSDEEEALKCLEKPRTWLVFGAGISGNAAVSHLSRYGESVYLSDDRDMTMTKGLNENVTFVNADKIPWDIISTVVLSPGVPPDHKIPLLAHKLGKDVITEIDLGFDRYQGKILAVTGTNGKSTTVAMTEYIFRQLCLPAAACGNIGLPPSALHLREETSDHTAIIELSSYQLEGSLYWPARAAAITSFSFDHLARHKTMNSYFEAKWRITSWLSASSLLVVMDDVAKFALQIGARWPDCRIVVIGRSSSSLILPPNARYLALDDGICHLNGRLLDINSFGISGAHNHVNALMAALIGAEGTDRAPETLLPLLAGYRPLKFRCEVVYRTKSRIVVNDSKSTNLESTLSALSMVKSPAVLIMGGQGKGESYRGLDSRRQLLRYLITFGASRDAISHDAPEGVSVKSFEKMRDAVLHGLQLARDNNCDLIFSPGCASFDEFRNFEHRGDVFNELVSCFCANNF